MCKVKYQGHDGALFDTKEECEEYDQQPRVYVITDRRFRNYIVDVVLTVEEAEEYVSGQSELAYASRSVNRYKKSQNIPISDPYVIDKNTFESLWEKIKQKVLGGKDVK